MSEISFWVVHTYVAFKRLTYLVGRCVTVMYHDETEFVFWDIRIMNSTDGMAWMAWIKRHELASQCLSEFW
jgi:hypothetical protein